MTTQSHHHILSYNYLSWVGIKSTTSALEVGIIKRNQKSIRGKVKSKEGISLLEKALKNLILKFHLILLHQNSHFSFISH